MYCRLSYMSGQIQTEAGRSGRGWESIAPAPQCSVERPAPGRFQTFPDCKILEQPDLRPSSEIRDHDLNQSVQTSDSQRPIRDPVLAAAHTKTARFRYPHSAVIFQPENR